MAWYLGCLFLPRKYRTNQRCQHSTLCHLLLFCSKCAGAFLIYSVVSKLVLEQQKIIELQTRNHQLSTQTLDNTFSGSLDIDQERHFVSSKHEGLGLGTESIIWISLRLIARPNPVSCLLAISDSSACSKFWKMSFCFSSPMQIPSSCTEK